MINKKDLEEIKNLLILNKETMSDIGNKLLDLNVRIIKISQRLYEVEDIINWTKEDEKNNTWNIQQDTE